VLALQAQARVQRRAAGHLRRHGQRLGQHAAGSGGDGNFLGAQQRGACRGQPTLRLLDVKRCGGVGVVGAVGRHGGPSVSPELQYASPLRARKTQCPGFAPSTVGQAHTPGRLP
jgi:hypothetical protein